MSVANIIRDVKEKYDIHISPGTVYPIIYKMEREGYIEKIPKSSKRIYVLTAKGRNQIATSKLNNDLMHSLIAFYYNL